MKKATLNVTSVTKNPSSKDGALLVKVWCPYCNREHTHGVPLDRVNKKACRVPHCNDRTNYQDTVDHSYWFKIPKKLLNPFL
jgi:hypothetical protein